MNALARLGRWRWLAILPVVVIALVGLVVFYFYLVQERQRWDRRFGVVRDGVLLRGCQPSPLHIERIRRDYGVKTIISLVHWGDLEKHPECAVEREFARKHGIRFFHMPISIPRPEEIRQFLEIVSDRENCPVFMHCLSGTVRTGALAAVFRMERDGWSNQQALDEMVAYGFILSKAKTKHVADFVRQYRTATDRANEATSLRREEDAAAEEAASPLGTASTNEGLVAQSCLPFRSLATLLAVLLVLVLLFILAPVQPTVNWDQNPGQGQDNERHAADR